MATRPESRAGLLSLLVSLWLLPPLGCHPALHNAPSRAGQTVKQTMKMREGLFRRSYRVHVPRGYDPSRSTPLVVVLHGAFSTAKEMEKHSGFSHLADREGFIVLYPNGITLFGLLQHWNAGHCCGKAAADGVDDVGYLEAAIRDLSDRLNVDPSRIYMTGFSNGGMMTYRFGAEKAGLLAAIAPLAGSIGGRSTPAAPSWQVPEPAAPLPVLIMHGKLDGHVPCEGGAAPGKPQGRRYASVDESAAFWVRANGCDPVPEEVALLGGSVLLKRWHGCREDAEVRLYVWERWGHAWPGPPFTDSLEPDDPFRNFHTAETIWEFFKAHRRHDVLRRWP